MAFGIERRNIPHDNTDRDEFVRCLFHLGPFFLISASALFSLRFLRMSFWCGDSCFSPQTLVSIPLFMCYVWYLFLVSRPSTICRSYGADRGRWDLGFPCIMFPWMLTNYVGKVRRGNYIFISWMGDHSPRHVHVYKKWAVGFEVGSWELDSHGGQTNQ